MIKSEELSNPNSCLNRAKDNEFVFSLLGRDDATPETLAFWIKKRIELGKNKPDDPQILETQKAIADLQNGMYRQGGNNGHED